MKSFLRTPFFWLLFSFIALIASGITWHFFPQAYSIINLSITIDRAQAITAAQDFSQQFKVGPCDCQYAVSFTTDEQAKTFVELEAGGKEALIAMMDQRLYLPYTWVVRQFKPFDQHQLFVKFTPDGIPYGFQEILSEETESSSLSPSDAQQKAESFASAAPWDINLSLYNLVETSQEATPKKRIDHTFTYERIDQKVGDGFYRLKIVVSGDHVTKLSHELKIPEAFTRRYAQMRSANTNLAYLATLAMLVLYIIGCSFIGLIALYRARWLITTTPFYCALFVAFLVSLNTINKLPLSWMEYTTAFSPLGFLVQQAIGMLYSFIFMTLILMLIFTAAESLTRKAFGHQIQLWRIFTPDCASSFTVMGYTFTGYLLVPLLLCYTTLFTITTTRYTGWWIPSSSLFNPDILATYFPWLESISLSLQAGFMEECLFRAIPLTSAALLGNKYGKRNWFMAGAFILQAIIFGAAHANYPAQPAYARLVELLADSAVFGALYLSLGLLPAIIAHVIYDVFWFGLPIFVAHSFSAYINTALIIIFSLIPLLIVIIRRLRHGFNAEIPSSFYNNAWRPPSPIVADEAVFTSYGVTLSGKRLIFLIVISIAGFISWLVTTPFTTIVPPFTSTRQEAQEHAKIDLSTHDTRSHWYPITFAITDLTLNPETVKQHHFIWQTAGKDIYRQLLGSYLMPAHWVTRFVDFDGSLMDRAEEYQIFTLPDGTIIRRVHKLPETVAGAVLSKEQAFARACDIITNRYAITSDQLYPISAVADKHPERVDWMVTYSTTAGTTLPSGEKRIIIMFAGDELSDLTQTIHIPENWDRTYENTRLMSVIITQICQLLIYLLMILGALAAVLRWRTHTVFIFSILSAAFALILLFELSNSWPSVFAFLKTNQPFNDQIFRFFSIPAVILLLRSIALAIMVIFVTFTHAQYYYKEWWQSIITGIALAVGYAGIEALTTYLIPSTAPEWPHLAALRFFFPIIAGIDSMVLHYISVTVMLLVAIVAINTITRYGTQHVSLLFLISFITSFMCAGLLHAENLLLFAVTTGIYTFSFIFSYLLFMRYDRSSIPIAVGGYISLIVVREFIYNSYPGVRLGTISTLIIIAILSSWWSKKIHSMK